MNAAVVGAGIFGLASALELRKRGHTVTVFEQGKVPHERASSTDVSKAIRRVGYDEIHLNLLERARTQWQEWHDRLSRSIYERTGLIHIAAASDNYSQQRWGFLKDQNADVEILDSRQARKRFPQFVYRDDDVVYHDSWGGYLRSEQAVADLAALAIAEGVTIRTQTPVLEIAENPSGVQLTLTNESAVADRVVIAVGAWMSRLVPELGRHVRVTRQEMAFFRPPDPTPFRRDRCPVWCVHPDTEAWYGFPMLREGFFKIASDQLGPVVEPDIERSATPDFLAAVEEFVALRLPGIAAGELVGSRSCLYTNTVDHQFVVDWVPDSQRVAVAGCGCGHGFKFGGVIGMVVADHIEDKANPLGEPFRMHRLDANL